MTSFCQFLLEESRKQQTTQLGSEDQRPQIDRHVINIAKQIVRDCRPYLNEHSKFDHYPLLRGMKVSPKTIKTKKIRKRRNPRDTLSTVHQLTDQYFKQQFGTAFRSNSIFATGSSFIAENYGDPVVIFPKGRFEHLWSPRVKDLYLNIQNGFIRFVENQYDITVPSEIRKNFMFSMDGVKKPTEDTENFINKYFPHFLQTLEYKQSNLSQAIRSGNEVMVTGEQYYAVNFMWYEENNIGELIRAVLQGDVEKYI